MKSNFDEITVLEAQNLFLEIRKNFVLRLAREGLSQREISRRMGGSSLRAVNQVLSESKEQENEPNK